MERRVKPVEQIVRHKRRDPTADYMRLLGMVARAAGLLIVVKVVASVILTGWLGGRVEVRFFNGLVPYMATYGDFELFRRVVIWSTVAVVATAGAALLVALVRWNKWGPAQGFRIDGWAAGLIMAGSMLAVEQQRFFEDTTLAGLLPGVVSLMVLIAVGTVFVVYRLRRQVHMARSFGDVQLHSFPSPRSS